MTDREARAREIQENIQRVLIDEWDPIGIGKDPTWPRDEYDAYVGQIYGFLARGESTEFLANHLAFIEDKLMGLGKRRSNADLLPVAEKLKAIDVSLRQQ